MSFKQMKEIVIKSVLIFENRIIIGRSLLLEKMLIHICRWYFAIINASGYKDNFSNPWPR